MGNAGSNIPRERHKSSSSDIMPGSPSKDGQAFVFEKKPDSRLVFQTSNEDEFPSKVSPEDPEFMHEPSRPRANTLSEGQSKSDAELTKSALPTVFKWDGGGKQVYISGTFTGWKRLPMVRSHGDFVTIIDLPEGDHQYKFYVDGEWRHDPKLVSIRRFNQNFFCLIDSFVCVFSF